MNVKAYKTHKIQVGEDLFKILDKYLPPLTENSVVAITSKIISLCQGDVVKDDGRVNKEELIKKEADYYIESKVPTPYGKIFLTRKDGHIVFSAGIDESNADGNFILWPKNLQQTTNNIWEYLRKRSKVKNLGVIVTDSRLTPVRTGVIGFTMTWCGIKPFNKKSGEKDLFGREIKYTNVNIIEALGASAALEMGEVNEQTPLALLTDLSFVQFQTRVPSKRELKEVSWPIEKDMYGSLLTSVKWHKGGSEK